MAHTLISFLGRGNTDRGKRYRKATYQFDEGHQQTTDSFGLGLANYLKPDRLVILGTTGSMWDVMLFSIGLNQEHDEALWAAQSADANRTRQAELDDLTSVVSKQIRLPVNLRLIPYGCNTEEQIEILQLMALDVVQGDTVTLDVTHGLRHLPMLAQMSALYLRQVKNVQINGLYYGALDMTHDGLTPVMNLQGILDMADWIGAVQSFDKDGDYSVFSSLLEEQLPKAFGFLKDAAFYERTSRVGQARSKVRDLMTEIEQKPLIGIGSLFSETLQNRLAWYREDRLYLRQQSLARLYLEHNDYLRAALLGFEAFITRLMQQEGMVNPDNWETPGKREDTVRRHQ